MKAQTMLDQPRPEMLVLPRILPPPKFSITMNSATKNEKALDPAVENMVNRLMRHPVLAGMNRRDLVLLAGWAKTAQFNKGQVIFHEGDLADRFYLIETGKARLESSSGSRDPRSGWSWMFPPHLRTYTATALGPVTAIFVYAPTLRKYCEEDHSFGYAFLKRMSLEMYRRQIARNGKATLRNQSRMLQPVAAA